MRFVARLTIFVLVFGALGATPADAALPTALPRLLFPWDRSENPWFLNQGPFGPTHPFGFGLDFGKRDGQPHAILAMFDGRVVSTKPTRCLEENQTPATSIRVRSTTNPRVEIAYVHPSRIDVTEGQRVLAGQILGASGAIGCGSTGIHIHTELFVDGRRASWVGQVIDGWTVAASGQVNQQLFSSNATLQRLAAPFQFAAGTFTGRGLGLNGTSFLMDTLIDSKPVLVASIVGPSGWNGGASFNCGPYRPRGIHPRRALCWQFAMPLDGSYEAFAYTPDGVATGTATVRRASQLAPPEILTVSQFAGSVSVVWRSANVGSFLVILRPVPDNGTVVRDAIVAGTTRAALFVSPSLTSGATYRVAVFALSVDVRHDLPLNRPFNIGDHEVEFVAN